MSIDSSIELRARLWQAASKFSQVDGSGIGNMEDLLLTSVLVLTVALIARRRFRGVVISVFFGWGGHPLHHSFHLIPAHST